MQKISKLLIIFIILLLVVIALEFRPAPNQLEVSAKCIQTVCRNTAYGFKCESMTPHVYEMVYDPKSLELKLTRRNRCNNGEHP